MWLQLSTRGHCGVFLNPMKLFRVRARMYAAAYTQAGAIADEALTGFRTVAALELRKQLAELYELKLVRSIPLSWSTFPHVSVFVIVPYSRCRLCFRALVRVSFASRSMSEQEEARSVGQWGGFLMGASIGAAWGMMQVLSVSLVLVCPVFVRLLVSLFLPVLRFVSRLFAADVFCFPLRSASANRCGARRR